MDVDTTAACLEPHGRRMHTNNLIKGEIDIDLFIHAYHIIMLEETRNELMPRGWYTDEDLKLAGIFGEPLKKDN